MLKVKRVSNGSLVVCDGQEHIFSSMRIWDSHKVGWGPCWCEDADKAQQNRWEEVNNHVHRT